MSIDPAVQTNLRLAYCAEHLVIGQATVECSPISLKNHFIVTIYIGKLIFPGSSLKFAVLLDACRKTGAKVPQLITYFIQPAIICRPQVPFYIIFPFYCSQTYNQQYMKFSIPKLSLSSNSAVIVTKAYVLFRPAGEIQNSKTSLGNAIPRPVCVQSYMATDTSAQ